MNVQTAKIPSPLDAVVHDAARKLLNLRMTRIVGAGDKHDATNLIADLEALASIVDPVVLAIGMYAKENLGITDKAIKENFTEQLSKALDGCATFNIEEAGDRAQAYLTAAE